MDDGKPSEIAEKIIEQVKSTVLKEFLQSHPLTFEVKGKGKDRAEQERERGQSQQSRQTQLLEEYLRAVEEVKRARKLPVEEKLRRLISPLKELQDLLFPAYPQYHQFVDDTYIDLGKELDLERLAPVPSKYSILDDGSLGGIGLLHAAFLISPWPRGSPSGSAAG